MLYQYYTYIKRVGMRVLVRAILPDEAGNRSVKGPNFIKNIRASTDNYKAEAAYFTHSNGDTSVNFTIDVPSSDMIATIAEPFFEISTRVGMQPVMKFEDLKKGLSATIN
ncbi:MAG: hypothetical protein ACJ70Q_04960 [Nitrososphaera sp.]